MWSVSEPSCRQRSRKCCRFLNLQKKMWEVRRGVSYACDWREHPVLIPGRGGQRKQLSQFMLGMKTVAISAVLGATAAGLLASSAAYAFVAPSPTAGAAVEATVDRRQRGAFTSTFPQLVPCYRRPRARSGSLSMMVSPSTGSTPGERGGSHESLCAHHVEAGAAT